MTETVHPVRGAIGPYLARSLRKATEPVAALLMADDLYAAADALDRLGPVLVSMAESARKRAQRHEECAK